MLQDQTQNSWADTLVTTFVVGELSKRALVGWPPQDESLYILEDLEKDGYQEVRWQTGNSQCFTCNDLNDQVWPLADFLYFTKHEAPVFSKSHVGCRCSLLVTGVNHEPQTVVAYQ